MRVQRYEIIYKQKLSETFLIYISKKRAFPCQNKKVW